MKVRDEKRGGFGCFIMGAICVFVPVLYVLGIGPAYVIATQFPATKDFVAAVYRPVIYVGGNFEPIRGVFDWYMGFWMGS